MTGRRRGSLVTDQPAVVVRETCCGSNRCTIAWYHASTDASYAITLAGAAASAYGEDVDPADFNSARALGTLAATADFRANAAEL